MLLCAQTPSCVQFFVTPWTVARQALWCMGFSRQEYWNGLPCPPLGNLPDPGIKPVSLMSPALADRFFTTEPPGTTPTPNVFPVILCKSPHWNDSVSSWMLDPCQFSSVAQSCLTLCDPMNCSMPGLPVHHQLPESTQTHVHRVGDAIQPSDPLWSASPPALNLSQHQGLFQ